MLPVWFSFGWQLRLCELNIIFGNFLSTSLPIFFFPQAQIPELMIRATAATNCSWALGNNQRKETARKADGTTIPTGTITKKFIDIHRGVS